MDDGRSGLVVLLLRDPHLLEGREGGQDGTTDPDGVFTFRRGNNLNLHRRGCESGNLLLHTVRDTGVHGGAARLDQLVSIIASDICNKVYIYITHHDDVAVEILSDINVALHDGVVRSGVDAAAFKAQDTGLEEGLWSAESLVANSDDLAVRELVGLLQAGGLRCSLYLLLEVESDIAELLLDIADDFTLSSGGERITTLSQDLHKVVSQITASHVDTRNSVRKSKTLVDWNDVGHTITGVENDTSGTTGGVKRKDGLDGDVEGRGVESFEDDLGHLLTVRFGIDRSLGQQNRVFLRSDTEFVVEGVMPDLFHIIPVRDDTVLNGVSKGKDTTLGLCFITNIGVLLAHTNHNTATGVSFLCSHISFAFTGIGRIRGEE